MSELDNWWTLESGVGMSALAPNAETLSAATAKWLTQERIPA